MSVEKTILVIQKFKKVANAMIEASEDKAIEMSVAYQFGESDTVIGQKSRKEFDIYRAVGNRMQLGEFRIEEQVFSQKSEGTNKYDLIVSVYEEGGEYFVAEFMREIGKGDTVEDGKENIPFEEWYNENKFHATRIK